MNMTLEEFKIYIEEIAEERLEVSVCQYDEDKHAVVTLSKLNDSDFRLPFKVLLKLSQFFGTEDITTEDWSTQGCETCDNGSRTTHEIDIKNITKNHLKT